MTQRMENINQHLNRLELDNKIVLQQLKDLIRHAQIHDEEIRWLADNVTRIKGRFDNRFSKPAYRSKKVIMPYAEYLRKLNN